MLFVNHLKAIWIKERLHCFSESRVVFLYIGMFFFCIPLKLHNFTIPYLYGYNHITDFLCWVDKDGGLVHIRAAVDIDRLPGDEITVHGGKKNHCPHEVLRVLISLKRASAPAVLKLLTCQYPFLLRA